MGITTEYSLVFVLHGLSGHSLVVGPFEDDFQIFTIIDTAHLPQVMVGIFFLPGVG